MAYSFGQLQSLWLQAGGNPTAAKVAAAVAMAESSGNPDATGPVGERGLWQIALSHGAQSTYDPLGNARAAVAISNNGSNWKPWCTAYTDGACGTQGGVYDPLGAGSPVGRALAAGGGGGVIPGGGTTGGVVPVGLTDPLSGTVLDVATWWHFVDVAINNVLYGGMVLVGGTMIVIGLVAMAHDAPGAAVNAGAVMGITKRVVLGE